MIFANSEMTWKSGGQIENLTFLLFEAWMDGNLAMFVTGMKCPFGKATKNYESTLPFEHRAMKSPIWRIFFKSNFKYVPPNLEKCNARQMNGDETNFSKMP